MPELDQHFLVDGKICAKMAKLLQIRSGETVLEIGAGTGRISRQIAKKASVLAVESDHQLVVNFPKMRNVRVMEADGVKALKQFKFDRVCGNLPFSILEPFFRELDRTEFKRGVFIVGGGFYQKLAGIAPGIKLESSEAVKKESFRPMPRKDAALVVVSRQPSLA